MHLRCDRTAGLNIVLFLEIQSNLDKVKADIFKSKFGKRRKFLKDDILATLSDFNSIPKERRNIVNKIS